MVLTLESVNIEMTATDQYFTRILFIMQQKVVVNIPSVEEIPDSSFAWKYCYVRFQNMKFRIWNFDLRHLQEWPAPQKKLN